MANDPNTIQYVIQEDGFWYVASKDRTPGVPELTVSAKGVANGLSTEYNDGYDFGPDSYNPSVTSGVPLTQTSGIQEAIEYQQSNNLPQKIKLSEGNFVLNKIFKITQNYSLEIEGSGAGITFLVMNFVSSTPYMTFIADQTNLHIHSLTFDFGGQSSSDIGKFINVYFGGNGKSQTIIKLSDFSISGTYEASPGGILSTNGGTNYQNAICIIENGIIQNYSGGDLFDIGQMQNIIVKNIYVSNFDGSPVFVIYPGSQSLYAENVTLNSSNNFLFSAWFPADDTVYSNIILRNVTAISAQGLLVLDSPSGSTYTGCEVNFISIQGGVLSDLTEVPVFISNSKVVYSLRTHSVNGLNTSPSTPTVPSSGTAQQNTNPYAVKVYVNGGALTEVQITIGSTTYTVYSNSTASAVYEGFTLPPGASITLTYSTAPTWSWVPE